LCKNKQKAANASRWTADERLDQAPFLAALSQRLPTIFKGFPALAAGPGDMGRTQRAFITPGARATVANLYG
jgi:hypothetical protein